MRDNVRNHLLFFLCGLKLRGRLKLIYRFIVFLDALLADLQNTVSSEGNHVGGGNATPGYGSLNGARVHTTTAYRSYDNRTSPLPSQSVRPLGTYSQLDH